MKSIILSGALALAAFTMSAQEPGFTPLFDGKSLTGWEGRTNHWSVEDGAITGITSKENPAKGNNFLIAKQDGTNMVVSDFEIRFSYKFSSDWGNSGLQYRSIDRGNFVVNGYQGDFEVGTTFSGILYEEGKTRGIMCQRGEKVVFGEDGKREVVGKTEKTSKEIQESIKKGDWNEYVIIAKGNHLQHFINGHMTADIMDNDPKKQALSGILAFQIHAGPPMQVQFKNVRIKKLSKDAAAAEPLRKFAGKWVPVAVTMNGEAVEKDKLDGVLLTIDGNKYTSKIGEKTDAGTISVDESKSPAAMNVLRQKSDGDTVTIPAIYEIKGDSLKVCYAIGAQARPTDFKSEADSGTLLVTYKRD